MTALSLPVTGGCLCGAIRFAFDQPPSEGAFCHCSICRRSYGGLFGIFLRVPAAGFRLTRGEPKLYRSSPIAVRSFCDVCGSPIAFAYDGNADLWITLGALDHPEDWPMTPGATWGATSHVQVDARVPWHAIDDGLPQMKSPGHRQAAEAAARSEPTRS
jgi:hypothetical protein